MKFSDLKINKHYFLKIDNSLNSEAITLFFPFRKPIIYIKETTPLSVLIHEKTHVLQYYRERYYFIKMIFPKNKVLFEIEAYFNQCLFSGFDFKNVKKHLFNLFPEYEDLILKELKELKLFEKNKDFIFFRGLINKTFNC